MSDLAQHAFAAVLFDLDSTLVDSSAAVERSWVRWAREENVDPRRLLGHHGWRSAQIVEELVPAQRVGDALERIDALELADVAGVVALPGAGEALAAVPAGHAAIVTSGTRTLALHRLRAAGLTPPSVLVTADDVTRGKPDPEPFVQAATMLGVAPARSLVVEDAPSGITAARTAGAATLAVSTTSAADDLNADMVVSTLGDVVLWWDGSGVRVRGLEE